MSAQREPARDARAKVVLAWARRAVLLYAAGAGAYLMWRFDVQTLPRGGVTPLSEYRPGTHLLVDTRADEPRLGDALLFQDELGRTLLARVAAPAGGPDSPRADAALWMLADGEGGLPDSRTLGPIPRERVLGRVVCALPGLD